MHFSPTTYFQAILELSGHRTPVPILKDHFSLGFKMIKITRKDIISLAVILTTNFVNLGYKTSSQITLIVVIYNNAIQFFLSIYMGVFKGGGRHYDRLQIRGMQRPYAKN